MVVMFTWAASLFLFSLYARQIRSLRAEAGWWVLGAIKVVGARDFAGCVDQIVRGLGGRRHCKATCVCDCTLGTLHVCGKGGSLPFDIFGGVRVGRFRRCLLGGGQD